MSDQPTTTAALCTDDWCATCSFLNEDARHVYGCDCTCNLLAQATATTAPRYSWTQAICEPCWTVKEPGRRPIKLRIPEVEQCAYCGHDTNAGIYVRDDPTNVRFPKEKD